MSSRNNKKIGLEAFMRELVKESLRDWFKKEDWVRISTAGNIVGPCGTSKNDKNPDRCLPRKKAESLTKAQRAATARKKKKAGKKGKTVVKNTKKAKVTERETQPEKPSIFLNTPKFNQPKKIQQHLIESIKEISLSKNNAADIHGDVTGGTFTVGDITYEYQIKNIKNPYKDLGTFYNIQFTPKGELASIPKGGKENYIKIISTMYKIIVDFLEKEKPEYFGISSLDNIDDKNYHTVYNRLTDNNLKLIPGYFRKESNLYFDSPQGKGRFVVLKRKDINKTNIKNETSNPQDGKATPYGSGYKKITKEDLRNLVAGTIYELKNQNTLEEDKDDRCTRIAKRKYETWPSAYASGAVVRCRKGEIWKDLKEEISEGKATCCGRCGRVHIPKSQGGHGCKRPYLGKKSLKHCKNK